MAERQIGSNQMLKGRKIADSSKVGDTATEASLSSKHLTQP